MASFPKSVVIHGHFYQPPREDPWLGDLERQPSAAPFHDWNTRIEAECYRTVVAARMLGAGGRIQEIVNTLRSISFNFGPTLLDWMEATTPTTYQAIREADRQSRVDTGGYGNALAQAYHHTILPLASRREKVTEVRWGITDFRRRFGREPSGMWLPETAVDGETLDVLAQEALAFTIVAPHQVETVPKGGMPGLFRTKSGRSIALFVYDGPLSHDVAFGPLLKDAGAWARRMVEGSSGKPGTGPRLVSMATDGETYGHHHRFGEMALASVIHALRAAPGIRLENFSSFLAHTPPEEEVVLSEPTSWSCVHGVERWRGNCGCRMDPDEETQQEWRTPLREAMEWLATRVHARFEAEAPALLGDPWRARDDFASVVTGVETIEDFLNHRLPSTHTAKDRIRAAELLESERNALRLFTSCAWFFDDLAGLEPTQILRYAARALELTDSSSGDLEEGFLARLREARSNETPARDGATIYIQEAKPEHPAHVRVAAGAAAVVRAGGELPSIPGFVCAVDDDLRVRVSQAETGISWELDVSIEKRVPEGLQIRVLDTKRKQAASGVPDGEFLLTVEDLPEAFRVPLEESLVRDALGRFGSREDLDGLLAGTRTPGQVLGNALVSFLRKLGGQEPGTTPDPVTLAQAHELALLHLQRAIPIPFDAQTEFHRLLSAASPQAEIALAVLRRPLGFVFDQ